MAAEYNLVCLPDRLFASREARVNRVLAERSAAGWELVRLQPMRVLASDTGLFLLFRREAVRARGADAGAA